MVSAERVTQPEPSLSEGARCRQSAESFGKAPGRDIHRGDRAPGHKCSLGPSTHVPPWERGCLDASSASSRAVPREGRGMGMEGAATSGELAGASLGVHVRQARKTTAIITNSLILQKRKAQGVGRGNIPGGVQGRGELGNASKDVTFMARPDD